MNLEKGAGYFNQSGYRFAERGVTSQNAVRTAGMLGCSATASPRPTWFVMLEKVCGIFVANSADWAGFADSSGF